MSLLAACAGQGSAGSDEGLGTIRGTVLLGPRCPVETVASPCPDTALPDVEVQLTEGDQVVDTTVSDGDGRFVFQVEPGSYLLRAVMDEPMDSIRFAKPVNVVVVANESVTADVLVDTGIR
jgi:hypothetical protein